MILTDDLVPYPNTPNAISEHNVDFVVEVDSVGDSSKISSGAIRDTKNPRDILLAKQAAKVIVNSGYFRNGFSIQTGSGGASLAAVKYIMDSWKNSPDGENPVVTLKNAVASVAKPEEKK